MKSSPTKAPAPLDLSRMGNLASMLAAPAPATPRGEAMLFDMDLIDEDPTNLRREDNPGFSDASIAEMAASIRANLKEGGRGVIVPISLHPNPDKPGRYVINHGHRRFRGCRLVPELKQIPGHLDSNHSKNAQFIENLHQVGHTAREIADYIGGKIAQGLTQGQIASEIGKSVAWVSQHAQLLDLPQPIAEAVHSGQLTDLTVINELVRAHHENPQGVAKALAAVQAQAHIGGDVQGEDLAAKHASQKVAPINRETARALRKPAKGKRGAKTDSAFASGDVKRVERALSDHLATKVTIRPGAKGRIELVTQAVSWDHFNSLMAKMSLSKAIESED